MDVVISNAISLFFLWLFLTAGLSKVNPKNKQFYQELFNDYGFTSLRMIRACVVLLGILEIVLAFAMMIPALKQVAALGIAVLLMVYLLAMWSQLLKGKKNQNCGCAGPHTQINVSSATLARNIILMVLALWCYQAATDGSDSQVILSILLSGFLVLTYNSIEKIVANYQRILLMRGQ